MLPNLNRMALICLIFVTIFLLMSTRNFLLFELIPSLHSSIFNPFALRTAKTPYSLAVLSAKGWNFGIRVFDAFTLCQFIRIICENTVIFCWKNVSSFCSAKAPHNFSAKNITIIIFSSPVRKYRELLLSLWHRHWCWCHTLKFYVKVTCILWARRYQASYPVPWQVLFLSTVRLNECSTNLTIFWITGNWWLFGVCLQRLLEQFGRYHLMKTIGKLWWKMRS